MFMAIDETHSVVHRANMFYIAQNYWHFHIRMMSILEVSVALSLVALQYQLIQLGHFKI